MNHTLKLFSLIFSLIILIESISINNTNAQTTVHTDQAKVTLLMEENTASPGETTWIGFKFILKEGWHTYWKNPGDSGLPIKINWDIPDKISRSPNNSRFNSRLLLA